MGRRKIEIQPITHERNRSVTFLKRKNGLFKKAYELGVLCSVDVAVIIFEERPGHNLKLYQYGSSNIHDIVQRHLRHDGEKDTRGPTDFSGQAGSGKLDDGGEGDDEDLDDDMDDASSMKGGPKRRGDGRIKSDIPSDPMNSNHDYIPRVINQAHLPSHHQLDPVSLPLHQPHHQRHGLSSLPVSSDRLRPAFPHAQAPTHSQHQSKKIRLDIDSAHAHHAPHPHSRSSADDPMPPSASSSGSYTYPPPAHPHATSHPHSTSHSNSHTSHQHHQQPFRPSSSSSSSGFPQYSAFLPGGHAHGTPPTPTFVPLQSDFSLSNSSSRVRGGSSGGPGAYAPRSSGANGTYDGMYAPRSAGGPGGGDMFPPFLDTDDQGRSGPRSSGPASGSSGGSVNSASGTGRGAFGLDWPVHTSPPVSAGGHAGSTPRPGTSNGRLPSAVGGGDRRGSEGGRGAPPGEGGSGSTADWLDFLSGNNNGNAPAGSGSPKGVASARAAGVNWERGGSGAGDEAMAIDDLFSGMGGENGRARGEITKKEGGGVG